MEELNVVEMGLVGQTYEFIVIPGKSDNEILCQSVERLVTLCDNTYTAIGETLANTTNDQKITDTNMNACIPLDLSH